jgi:NAD(P)-dependent dehydrogenase (short-subunit alcohol dehydrogenase family)
MTGTERPVVLVTGGNSGIGLECARALARNAWQVVIASRDRETSAAAVQRICAEAGDGTASELGLDLGSMQSIRAFAAEIEARDLPLRALVCNAGLQVTGSGRRSADGYEITFAVNHLGHFLLANLLLGRLLAHAPARLVVVASGVHDPTLRTGMPKPRVESPEALAAAADRPGFDGRLAYVNSKLCNLWFMYELVRRLATLPGARGASPLTVNGFDPGLVPGSGLARDYPAPLRFVWDRVLPGVATLLSPVVPTINPAWKAGDALARLVTDPALAGVTGKYFPSHARWQAAASSDASYDERQARALWDTSVKLSGLGAHDGVGAA